MQVLRQKSKDEASARPKNEVSLPYLGWSCSILAFPFKIIYTALWVMTYFPQSTSFPTDTTLQAYRYSIAFSMAKDSGELHSLPPPVQTFTARTHTMSLPWSRNICLCSKAKKRVLLGQVFSKNCHICGTNSHVSASSNTTFLTSSSQGSIVIYPLHLHNLHFPPPLPFISHISFIITISTVTLYLEWLSRFVLGEI